MDPQLLKDAEALLPRMVELRRRIHRHPELGLDLPQTKAAVLEALDGFDLAIEESPGSSGLVATLEGEKPGPTLILRGDMDALPMPEDSGVDFRSEIEGAMHACGHDAHTAMLAAAVEQHRLSDFQLELKRRRQLECPAHISIENLPSRE